MAETNKVKYGLKSCYYAVITTQNGVDTYGTPVPFPGAVSLNLDSEQGDDEPFHADDTIYFNVPGSNGGYSGDFEVARVIDDFHTDVLGAVVDQNGLLCEDADAVSKRFALLCEFKGDAHATRHVLYNCTASRPAFGSATIEETAEPQTETLAITAIPQAFGDRHIVKSKSVPTDTNYATFFTAVQTPSF